MTRKQMVLAGCAGAGCLGAAVLAVLVLVLGWAAFGSSGEQAVAERAAARFHEQYNAGEYRQIYAGADPAFVSEDFFVSRLEGVRQRLGPVREARLRTVSEREITRGTNVILYYDAEFENGTAREEITYAVSGEEAVLLGYRVVVEGEGDLMAAWGPLAAPGGP